MSLPYMFIAISVSGYVPRLCKCASGSAWSRVRAVPVTEIPRSRNRVPPDLLVMERVRGTVPGRSRFHRSAGYDNRTGTSAYHRFRQRNLRRIICHRGRDMKAIRITHRKIMDGMMCIRLGSRNDTFIVHVPFSPRLLVRISVFK